ncbi:MAG: caspase family protein [Deltaproteobacteria bacterium]|nr:caspase family protein [Deltaproteobacteria bacterium]
MTARAASVALLLLLGAGDAFAGSRRLAVVVGVNAGLAEDVPLAYSELDARRVADVLRELGGFDEVRPAFGVDATALAAALEQARGTIAQWKQSGDRVLFVFYYSGHADERGLHLRGTLLPKEELLSRLGGSGADVRVGVVDACQSGALTRSKGVVARAAGGIELQDDLDNHGQALLASSGRAESAQESDALQGSFFTSHLLTGLRGAADANGDGEIGLREVYAYAYDRTVHSTVMSAAGIQHPSYAVELRGRRDIALTWPSRSAAFLGFRSRSHGPFLVLTENEDAVVAELPSDPGLTRRIGLRDGSYVIKKRTREGLLVGRVRLRTGADAVLDESEMQRVPYLALASKGDRQPGWLVLSVGMENGVGGVGSLYGFEAGYVMDFDWIALWPSVGVSAGRSVIDERLDVSVATLKPSLAAVRLVRFSRFHLFFGVAAAAPLTLQWLERQERRASLGFEGDGMAGTSLWLTDRVGLTGKLSVGGRWLRLEADKGSGDVGGASWRLALGAQVGLRLRF